MDTKTWKLHTRQIIEGSAVPLATEIKKAGKYIIERNPKRRGFVASGTTKDDFSIYTEKLIHDLKNQGKQGTTESDENMSEDVAKLDEAIDFLVKHTRGLMDKYAQPNKDIPPSVLREQKLLDLGLTFLHSASFGDIPYGEAYIKAGLPVNFRHPKTGRSALHQTCLQRVKRYEDFAPMSQFADMLINTEGFDLLIRDNLGRLGYEIVYRFGYDEEMGLRVREKTLEQAKERGITLTFDFEVQYVPMLDPDQ